MKLLLSTVCLTVIIASPLLAFELLEPDQTGSSIRVERPRAFSFEGDAVQKQKLSITSPDTPLSIEVTQEPQVIVAKPTPPSTSTGFAKPDVIKAANEGNTIGVRRTKPPVIAPAPPPDETAKRLKTGSVAVLPMEFEYDSHQLTQRTKNEISKLAPSLKLLGPDAVFSVIGHTDSDGDATYNDRLSKRRALAVVDELVNEHSMEREQFQANGKGEMYPLDTNATKRGRDRNRRVEVAKIS